jgi:hypothetical protein
MNLENFKEIYQKIIIENSDEFVTEQKIDNSELFLYLIEGSWEDVDPKTQPSWLTTDNAKYSKFGDGVEIFIDGDRVIFIKDEDYYVYDFGSVTPTEL